MLDVKRKFEQERNAMKQKDEEATKAQQSEILNRGGNKRAPIRLSLGTMK
jgi:hypothetical protein